MLFKTPDEFVRGPRHAVTVFGMSGVGKTRLAALLRESRWFHYSVDYRIGTPTRMGPGFLPMALGATGVGLGLAIAATALGRSGAVPRIPVRSSFFVLVAIAAFALLLERTGLVPATFVAVVVAMLGDATARPFEMVLLAALASLGNWLVFSVGLGLPMRAFEFAP